MTKELEDATGREQAPERSLEYVIDEADFEPGDRVHIDVKGEEITVFNTGSEYHALLNYCPHQSGPLCEGPVSGTLNADLAGDDVELSYDKKNEVVACPWHGWEFDIPTGELLAKRDVTVPRYRVVVDEGKIYVDTETTLL